MLNFYKSSPKFFFSRNSSKDSFRTLFKDLFRTSKKNVFRNISGIARRLPIEFCRSRSAIVLVNPRRICPRQPQKLFPNPSETHWNALQRLGKTSVGNSWEILNKKYWRNYFFLRIYRFFFNFFGKFFKCFTNGFGYFFRNLLMKLLWIFIAFFYFLRQFLWKILYLSLWEYKRTKELAS